MMDGKIQVLPDGTVLPIVSLRDRFAMAALTGLCATLEYPKTSYLIIEDELAADAWAVADAMLQARTK